MEETKQSLEELGNVYLSYEKPSLDELYDDLMHYGVKRRSGRYPWGSGDDPYQHSGDFLSRVNQLKMQGLTESEIAQAMGIVDKQQNGKIKPNTSRLRAQITLAKNDRRALEAQTAKSLREDGMSLPEIAKKMGYKNDSSIRALLDENTAAKKHQAIETAEFLKQRLHEKDGFIDVGSGVERGLGISKEKLTQALEILRMEGYEIYGSRIPQPTNPKQLTTVKLLCPPGTEHKETYDTSKIRSVENYTSHDDGKTFTTFKYPKSMNSKRLKIRYAEDGGLEKDGVIELRRGVPDLDLQGLHYAQVRILVDDKKYLKGMAVYSDDMPPGIDVIFNTNKKKDVPKLDVLKDIKKDPDNPFGSLIKPNGQSEYTDKNGKRQLSLINRRADEGDWSEWQDKLPSQFLSKQPLPLAKKQLGIAIKDKQYEFDEICSLTNPSVKKKLLESFADGCDSAAVHLYAAALPRQKHQVILPINSIKDNEVYAPRFTNGETVALIRYPHGGTFEIPILKVNNKNAIARKLIDKDAKDVVGITHKTAERLSGADFDGDSVMVIPVNDKVRIKSTKPLEGLVNFDPKIEYATRKEGDYYVSERTGRKVKIMANTQNEMGVASNLITDMTLRGASTRELARAVRHSMVVIDAEKHKLDYKQSEIDNGIGLLKREYQDGGASTLLSRSKSQTSVPKRQGTPKINIKGEDWYDPSRPEGALIYKKADDLYYPDRKFDKQTGIVQIRKADGKKITYNALDPKEREKYEPIQVTDKKTGEVYFTNKDGSIRYRAEMRLDKSTKMAETDDAYTLISKSNTPMERAYADYANSMKALANKARLEIKATESIKTNAEAKKKYKAEVESLNDKLKLAELNSPKERVAVAMANSVIEAKKRANPNMTKEEIKKHSQQALTKARAQVGASRIEIDITNREWEAIQAGAISETQLRKILNRADLDKVREMATPRSKRTLSSAQISRIKSMKALGYTNAEIANKLNISTSTVSEHL